MQKEYHLGRQPIPNGYCILEERVHLSGIQFHRQAAASFCRGSDQQVVLRPDPGNLDDKNAIAVVGEWRGWFFSKAERVGFVPKEISERLAANGLTNLVHGRLLKTYVSDGGFVEIIIQIIGPSDARTPYLASHGDMSAKIKIMEAEDNIDGILSMLLDRIDSEETDSRKTGLGVAPAPYEKLSIVYRKLRRYDDELAVLERWNQQIKAPGAMRTKLEDRLIKARERNNRKKKK